MEKKYNLKEEWVGIGLPVRIKKELFGIGETINKKAIWCSIEHLLEQNKKFQELRKSKEYREILNTGKMKEANDFFQELENIRESMNLLLDNQMLTFKEITKKKDETRNKI